MKIAKRLFTVTIVLSLIAALVYFSGVLDVIGKAGGSGGRGNSTTYVKNGYGISSGSEYATQIGMQILENGGNAVDAAIAVAYAIGVISPGTNGIGGGGSMMVYDPGKDEYKFFDYYSEAPTTSGYSSIGVPGLVAGMETVWETYGTKPMKELLQPAVDLAENGFVISDYYVMMFNSNATARQYLSFQPANNPLRGGESLRQPELAAVLRQIQQGGKNAFYQGEVAQKICGATSFTLEDLSNYRVNIREPVRGNFYGYEIITAPPPFSGITLIQMLTAFELTDIPNPRDNEAEYLESLRVITEKAHADRVKNISDPRFSSASYNHLAGREYVKGLLGFEDLDDYVEEEETESTTHIVVIDKDGMVVSSTNTLSSFYGSRVYCQGFFLNNSSGGFSSGINNYRSGKRPRTFTAPSIIRGDDGFVMGIGSPGGNRIIRVMAPIILDALVFDTDIKETVEKNRALFTDKNTLTLEISPDREKAFLTDAPYKYYLVPKVNDLYYGSIHAIASTNSKGMYGVADSRRDGSVEIRQSKP
ncbi:MAG: gamma-glutamyltransferase [Peptococcaceae bacterium]|nr:gamma-glutamyltransferase [Peptococcaceae bacterium]